MGRKDTWGLGDRYFDWGKPRGKDFGLHEIIILGPYPSAVFFGQLVEDLAPANIVLVVDDGFSRTDVGRIRQAIEEKDAATNVHVLYAHARPDRAHPPTTRPTARPAPCGSTRRGSCR